jgi:hypothetical protein
MAISMRRLLECGISQSFQKSKVKNRDVGRNGPPGLRQQDSKPHVGVVNSKAVLRADGERIKC